MQKLIKGLHEFQSNVFGAQRELFERLAHGQQPETLFITCSDSRINPNLLTQTDPGDLFIIRNAGNIIPPYGAANGGEGATVEFAVSALGVKDIIICGHSHCGAVKGMVAPETLDDLPAVRAWLSHAEATRRIVKENYSHLQGKDLVTAAMEENVLIQIEHLRTHPSVAARLARGELSIHGWAYKIETGEVFVYDVEQGQFAPLRPQSPATLPPPIIGSRNLRLPAEPALL
ncbi:MAG: carbonic anhydrase [Actinomycetota bacterium]